MTNHGRQILIFLFRFSLFLTGAWFIIFVAGWSFDHFADWRSSADPRHKILWHPDPDGSKIVLLGDSVFCSNFVDSADRMLGHRLATLSGEKVYQGALNGAKEDDFRSAARTIAERWPAGTIVFLDIIPTRFGIQRQGADTTKANYEKAFKRITRVEGSDLESLLNNHVLHPLRQSLFLLHNQEVVRTTFDHWIRNRKYFKVGEEYNRIWYEGDARQARIGLNVAKQIHSSPDEMDFTLLNDLHATLTGAGIKLVYVLTPYCREIVDSFETQDQAQRMHLGLSNIHEKLKSFLDKKGYEYIELYNQIPSENFANLVHLNESGEEIAAEHMASWLKNQGL